MNTSLINALLYESSYHTSFQKKLIYEAHGEVSFTQLFLLDLIN